MSAMFMIIVLFFLIGVVLQKVLDQTGVNRASDQPGPAHPGTVQLYSSGWCNFSGGPNRAA